MLEGQPNFRDLGGVRAGVDRVVVSGEVYRSGELSALSGNDLQTMEDLGVRTVVDLRSEQEAELHPDLLPPSVAHVAIPILPGGEGSAVGRFMQTFDPADFPPWVEVYRSLVARHLAELAELIRMVADIEARPLVFHCGTGKDRTGVAAALLLALLGVSWSDIEGDFLRSNALLRPRAREFIERWERGLEERGVRLEDGDRSQLEHFMRVEPAYLDAARDEMVRLGGSVDGYIRDCLGIEDGVRESLREQLLH